MKKNEINMIDGPIFVNVIRYTIPIILTGILQLLFNATDLIVVGQYCGSECVGAIGATNSAINLLVNFFIGYATGVSVSVANALGSGDKERVHKVIHTAIPFAFICGVILTICGLSFGDGIIRAMGTPEEILNLSALYFKIYFCGIIPNLIYNFGAAIFRASGDTKTPLIFLTISGVINIILNIFFVTVFKMSVDGVAFATVISQTISCVMIMVSLAKRNDECKFIFTKMRIHINEVKQIISIGLPAGIQGSLFSISNVIIQSSVNSFGAVAVAGNSACQSIEGFIFLSMNSFHQTALNFTGQNMGAGKIERVTKVLKFCIISLMTLSIVMSILAYTFAGPLLSLYITDSPEAIEIGTLRMLYIIIPYFACGIMDTLTGTIRGLGVSFIPMLICIFFVCIFRITWIYTIFRIPRFHSLQSLYISYIISWTLCSIAQGIALKIILKRKRKAII